MSTKQIFRNGLMATAGLAALGLTACANTSPHYGGATVYDYEGIPCGVNCAPGVVAAAPIRSAPVVATTHYGYEGVTCGTRCGVATTGVVSRGVSTGVVSSHVASPTFSSEVAPCPAGTTPQPDGSCLQSSGFSSYSSTYTPPVTTYSGTTSTYIAPELTTECCAPVTTSTYVAPSTTTTYGGYATSGGGSSTYLPIRK
ncbi:hypothetical protein [uncultured Algimonas sp.]|uniref:hypothetical protein n=1 Tax=uncultured Algimonas sp. TaxID=1547920 RepID=UPI002629E6D3|nr:hypothetical protein [uncultured Algimonas sp.]